MKKKKEEQAKKKAEEKKAAKEAEEQAIKIAEEKRQRRKKEEDKEAEEKKKKKTETAKKPKQTTQMSRAEKREKARFEARTLQTFQDWIFTYQQQQSIKDTGGIDKEEMIEQGILALESALGIRASRAPFTIESDGDCLWNALAQIANPHLTKEENARAGTAMRRRVMEEAIKMVRTMPQHRLELIQAAASAPTAPGVQRDPLTREELLTQLERYRENGRWDGDLGDLMPQIAASFTRTPLLVIQIDPVSNQTTGQYINPENVFNQPDNVSVLSVLIRYINHYESLLVPAEAAEALMEMVRNAETEVLEMLGPLPPEPAAPPPLEPAAPVPLIETAAPPPSIAQPATGPTSLTPAAPAPLIETAAPPPLIAQPAPPPSSAQPAPGPTSLEPSAPVPHIETAEPLPSIAQPAPTPTLTPSALATLIETVTLSSDEDDDATPTPNEPRY